MFDRFKKVSNSLTRTRESAFGRVLGLLTGRGSLDESFWENLEELLIAADVGVETTINLVERLRQRAKQEGLRTPESVEKGLREALLTILTAPAGRAIAARSPLEVILVVGVNGVGKTTSIAKLAYRYRQAGRKVILAAADTFRAAAEEQLTIWGQRVGVPVIAHQPGADPGAVVFDALQSAQAQKADVVIVDTAGRLHTKTNLMEELKKIRRVVTKVVPDGPHQVLLVVDANTGQNALAQARQFTSAVTVTGVILAKLDSSARGGMAFAISKELNIPIQYVGTGETLDDLEEFNPVEFVNALFGDLPQSSKK